jgi:hypothetical protein
MTTQLYHDDIKLGFSLILSRSSTKWIKSDGNDAYQDYNIIYDYVHDFRNEDDDSSSSFLNIVVIWTRQIESFPVLQINSLDYRDDIWLDFKEAHDGINLNTYRASAFDWSKTQRLNYNLKNDKDIIKLVFEHKDMIGIWMLNKLEKLFHTIANDVNNNNNQFITIFIVPKHNLTKLKK